MKCECGAKLVKGKLRFGMCPPCYFKWYHKHKQQNKKKSQVSIAKELGVTQQGVSHIQTKAYANFLKSWHELLGEYDNMYITDGERNAHTAYQHKTLVKSLFRRWWLNDYRNI